MARSLVLRKMHVEASMEQRALSPYLLVGWPPSRAQFWSLHLYFADPSLLARHANTAVPLDDVAITPASSSASPPTHFDHFVSLAERVLAAFERAAQASPSEGGASAGGGVADGPSAPIVLAGATAASLSPVACATKSPAAVGAMLAPGGSGTHAGSGGGGGGVAAPAVLLNDTGALQSGCPRYLTSPQLLHMQVARLSPPPRRRGPVDDVYARDAWATHVFTRAEYGRGNRIIIPVYERLCVLRPFCSPAASPPSPVQLLVLAFVFFGDPAFMRCSLFVASRLFSLTLAPLHKPALHSQPSFVGWRPLPVTPCLPPPNTPPAIATLLRSPCTLPFHVSPSCLIPSTNRAGPSSPLPPSPPQLRDDMLRRHILTELTMLLHYVVTLDPPGALSQDQVRRARCDVEVGRRGGGEGASQRARWAGPDGRTGKLK